MIKCNICGREFISFSRLGGHLLKHKILAIDYYDKYLKLCDTEGICANENCNKKTSLISLEKGYQKYCSNKCSANSKEVRNKAKATCKEIYGSEFPLQSEDIKKKLNKTNLERYGVIWNFQSEETKNKMKKTILEKYGVDCILKSKSIIEKRRESCLKKYGTDHPMKSKEILKKFKNTCLNKYGVTNSNKSNIVREKYKKTCLERFGVDNSFKVKEVRNKREQTWLKKYGETNPNRSKVVREKFKDTCLRKYGVTNVFELPQIQERIIMSRRMEFYNKIIESDRLKGMVTPNFTLEDFKEFGNVKHIYPWTCTKCNTIFEDNMDNGKIPRCPKCFPLLIRSSLSEKEIYDFVYNYFPDVTNNDRSILSGKELDIYIPSKNLAIEFNGLHWHSELQGKDKNYHLNKTFQCQEKGIQLIHIFEDEWIFKKEVVKSVIKSKLNLIINKIPARKCTVKPVDKDTAFNFLDSNHLQGYISGEHSGLFYDEKLVSILTIGKPRFDSNYEIEILRFCNKINTTIIGGLSKLISKINNSSIITYVDKRYGTGKSYESAGFKLIGESNPSYYYVNGSDLTRYNRLSFQKHKLESKLESFDPSLTEWQNMQLNGYDRIWDCGNLVFSYYK